MVRYDEYTETLDQSFDENKVHTMLIPQYLIVCQILSIGVISGFVDIW